MWLTDLRVICPDRVIDRGAIFVHEGKIAEIVAGDPPVDGINTGGLTAIPGIIDLHGDMLERDIEPRPRARFPIDMALYELDKRLAGSGITTAYAAVSFAWNQSDIRRQETAEEIIRTVHQLRDTLMVDFMIHGRFEMTNEATVPIVQNLLQEGVLDLVSIMDHTPGQGQYRDMSRFLTFVNEWLGISNEEIGSQLAVHMQEKLHEVQEAIREWGIVREVVRLAVEHGVIVASHDDDSVSKVADQAAMGVTVSEFPVNLEAAQAACQHGMHVIMGAPNAYRGESNTGNLSAVEAIKAGYVDILATDYFPAAPLQAIFHLDRQGVLPLADGVKLVSENPADAVRLRDRGRLDVGLNADLVLVDTSGTQPRVRATLRRGVPIYWDSYMARLTQDQALPYLQD
jgi:alpha-D-ribose 1-methylphosphonate 5-triphosphate diphosphatase